MYKKIKHTCSDNAYYTREQQQEYTSHIPVNEIDFDKVVACLDYCYSTGRKVKHFNFRDLCKQFNLNYEERNQVDLVQWWEKGRLECDLHPTLQHYFFQHNPVNSQALIELKQILAEVN